MKEKLDSVIIQLISREKLSDSVSRLRRHKSLKTYIYPVKTALDLQYSNRAQYEICWALQKTNHLPKQMFFL